MAHTEQVFDGDELLDLPATALATIIGSNQISCKEEQVVWMLSKCQNKMVSQVWIALQAWLSKGGLERQEVPNYNCEII